MATPRKRWFALECSVYREPWSREQKLSLAMLGMHMMDRWAADQLTPEQACIAHLQPGDVLTITGAESVSEGIESLRDLAKVVSIKIKQLDNGFTRVEWPKFSETQQLGVRTPGGKRPSAGQSPPADRPATAPPILSSPDLSSESEKNTHSEKNTTTAPADAGCAVEVPLDPNAPDVKFATDFVSALRKAHGDAAKLPELGSKTFRKRWVSEARLLFNDVGEPCARQVARWLFNAQDEDATWWRPNVLSIAKFRSKFATLRMRMETRSRATPKSVRGGGAEDALASLGKRLGFEVTG